MNFLNYFPDPGNNKRSDPQSVHKIPRSPRKEHYSERQIQIRREWLENVTGKNLKHVLSDTIKPETLAGNIENYIGSVQVPVGIAGPVLVNSDHVQEYVPIPVATTEGALISSISRGAHACNCAGGIDVQVTSHHMVRAPVFFCRDLQSAVRLQQWVAGNTDKITRKAESTSSYAALEKIEPLIFGDLLHLKFYYTTGDAAGQNMTTACTYIACEWIMEQLQNNSSITIDKYNIEGNLSGDKKANVQNFVSGRGISATAYCYIPARIMENVLHTTPQQFVDGWHAGEIAAGYTGMPGANINFANIIAGIFTATGQDIGCVAESSLGIFTCKVKNNGLAVTANLPSLVIGTVGGGTGLPTQRECLEIMDCYGKDRVRRLAEIITAACLALDLSTGAAIVSNRFVSAHESLGRNRPDTYLSPALFNSHFFNNMLFDKEMEIVKADKDLFTEETSIISKFTGKGHVYGLYRYILTARKNNSTFDIPAVLKIKAPDDHVLNIGYGMVKMTGDDTLPGLYGSQSHIFNLENSALREVNFYSLADREMFDFCPKIYGTLTDRKKDLYAVLMEDLSAYRQFDANLDDFYLEDHVLQTVLGQMARLHALYLDRYNSIPGELHIVPLSEHHVAGAFELLSRITEYNYEHYPGLISRELITVYRWYLDNINSCVRDMTDFPMTLVHGDFNPRNFFYRDRGDDARIILFDWELAFFQNPQRDLIEFLVFSLPSNAEHATYLRYADFYRQQLQLVTGKHFDQHDFFRILFLNAVYFGQVRLNLYLLGNNVMKFNFLKRIYRNLARFILEYDKGSI